MAFPPGFLDELRARIVLSELVGRRVALKRAGREFSGLCPFHNEKSPSFTVNDRKAFFHCFGCGAHGDAIGFVMRTEGLAFPDAVERLARDAGLDVPRATPAERERAAAAATLHGVVEAAARWFEKQLWMPAGKAALDYLRRRGLADEAIRGFRLGFAPDSRDGLKAALARENIGDSQLVEAGLAILPEGGREPYDRFRGRVMFPIADRRGRPIAFGGRVLGAGEPKYLNSPETPLFHKGANLYCLHLAREAAQRGQRAIVAEGYMDAIALHVAGFAGAVAPLGTALTEGQLAELWKIDDEPTLCFDGDNAGRRAAARAAERALPLLGAGKSLRFATLPAGEDPDSLIRVHGKAAMEGVLAAAQPLSAVVWDLETLGRPADTPERRASVERALSDRVASIADPVVREHYRAHFGARVRAELRAPARGPDRGPFVRRRPGGGFEAGRGFRGGEPAETRWFAAGSALRESGADLDPSRRERALLGFFLLHPELLESHAEALSALAITRPELERLRSALLDFASHEGGNEAAEPHSASGVASRLEPGALDDHLSGSGSAAAVRAARSEAEQWFGSKDREAELARWRHVAGLQTASVAGADELRRAEAAVAADPTWENLERLIAIKEHLLRAPDQGQ